MARDQSGSAPRAYYNDNNPCAAAVLRELIGGGVIASGDVDTRSIKDVKPDDLDGYHQVHFFAGGGLWSVAARMAGWPDDRPLWTGSCPCQPWSVSGKRQGADDPRHLWPDLHRLISARRPSCVVGEQVAGTAGYRWLDGVRADLAAEGYASRAVDIPACAVDSPQQRNRLYWVALGNADGIRKPQQGGIVRKSGKRDGDGNAHGALAGPESQHGRSGLPQGREKLHRDIASNSHGPVGRTDGARWEERECPDLRGTRWWEEGRAAGQPNRALRAANGSWWAGAEWLACRYGKTRRCEPETPLLVDGLPGRVGLWRLAGNAISPVLAAEVLRALMDH